MEVGISIHVQRPETDASRGAPTCTIGTALSLAPFPTECCNSEKACVCSPHSPCSQLKDYFIDESQEITQTSSRTKGNLAWTEDRNLAVHQESSNATRATLLTTPGLSSRQLPSSLFLPNSILNQHGSEWLPVPPRSQSLQSTRQGWPLYLYSVKCQIISGSFHLVQLDSIAQLALAGCTL